MGGIGSKSRSLGQILKHLVSTLAATVMSQASSNLLRMFVLIISGTGLNIGGVESKSRSLGQILKKILLALMAQSSSNLLRIFVLMISGSRIIIGLGQKVGH